MAQLFDNRVFMMNVDLLDESEDEYEEPATDAGFHSISGDAVVNPRPPCPAVFCQWGKDGATSGTTRVRSLRHTTYKKHFEGKEHFVLAGSGKVFQTFFLHIQICWWSPFWFLLL